MNKSIQYTIRDIPASVDARLKAQARKQGVSLNKLVLEKLGVETKKAHKRGGKVYTDLNWMIGALPLEETRLIDAAIGESREADKRRAYALYQSEINK